MTAYVVYNNDTKKFWAGDEWARELTKAKLYSDIKNASKHSLLNEKLRVGKVSVTFIETVSEVEQWNNM